MLLDILLLVGVLEKKIGDAVKITFSSHGGETFPNGLKITAEWIVERQVVRLEHVIPATELAQAKSQKDMEEFLLSQFVDRAHVGYYKKLREIRNRIEQEIRNATKT